MRIEINSGGLGGVLSVHDYMSNIKKLYDKTDDVVDAFADVKNKIRNVTGGLENLSQAVSDISSRISRDQNSCNSIDAVRVESDEFLDNAVRIDKSAAAFINQNRKEFFEHNPWLKPQSTVGKWIEQAWNYFKSIPGKIKEDIDTFREWISEVTDKIKETVGKALDWAEDTLIKAWNGVKKVYEKIKKKITGLILTAIGLSATVVSVISLLKDHGSEMLIKFIAEFIHKKSKKTYDYRKENYNTTDYGKGPDTIPDEDYADLCELTNNVTSGRISSEEFTASLKEVNEKFGSAEVEIVEKNGLDAVVIKLDDGNAIVIFAGTDAADYQDLVADVGIGVDSKNPWLEYEKSGALSIIKELESEGYTNIQTTGHSLGGYLAAYTAMNSDSVSECTTFDAPGFNSNEIHNSDKITSYVVEGSVVNIPGTSPGEVRYLEVEKNWAGPFPNHKIEKIADAMHKHDNEELKSA